MNKRAQKSCVIFLVFGLALLLGAPSSKARARGRLPGIWFHYKKGSVNQISAFFAGGQGVAHALPNTTSMFRWSRQGNRLTISGSDNTAVFTLKFDELRRTVAGRRVRVTRLRLRGAKGRVTTYASGGFGQPGRLKGTYCAHIGFAGTTYGRFSSMSKTVRYRFDGRGRVDYATRTFAMSSIPGPGSSQFMGHASRRGVGRYFVHGGDALILWPSGRTDAATLSGLRSAGRATSLTMGRRLYGPGLCNRP